MRVGECVCICESFVWILFGKKTLIYLAMFMYKMLSRVSHEKVLRFLFCFCVWFLLSLVFNFGEFQSINFRFLRTIQLFA